MKKVLYILLLVVTFGGIASAQQVEILKKGGGASVRRSSDNMVSNFDPSLAAVPLRTNDLCFDRRRGALYRWNGVSWQIFFGRDDGQQADVAYTVTNPASNILTAWDPQLYNKATVFYSTAGVDTFYIDTLIFTGVVTPGEIYVIDFSTTSRTTDADTVLIHFNSMWKTYDQQPLPEWKCPPRGRIHMAFRVHVSVEGATLVEVDDILGSWGHSAGSGGVTPTVLSDSLGNVTLDRAYNNFGATPSKITVDAAQGQTGGLEIETKGSNNFTIDIQDAGNVVIQQSGVDIFIIDSIGNVFIKRPINYSIGLDFGTTLGRVFRADNNSTVAQFGPNGFVTIDGDNRRISGNQQLYYRTQTVSGNQFCHIFENSSTLTSVNGGFMQFGLNVTYAPTSGSGDYVWMQNRGTINQTGTASQSIIGYDVGINVQGLLGQFYSIRDTTSKGFSYYQSSATKKNYWNGLSGFGTLAPSTKVHINGNDQLRYEDSAQGAGKVLVSDANGVASWSSMWTNSTATNNVTTDLVDGATPYKFVEVANIAIGEINTIVELPPFAGTTEWVTVKFNSTMMANATITGDGSETIDGAVDITITAQPNYSITFKKGASQWRIASNY